MILAEAGTVLHDAISSGNVWLAVCAGLAVLIPLVLHAMGKEIPIVTPVLDALLDLAVKMLPSKAPPAPPANPDGSKPAEGVSKVVSITKDEK